MPNRPKPTPAQEQALALLAAPSRAAKQAEVARTALALKNLATAAAALRAIPGAGAAADSIERALNAAVNKGGRFYVKAGKLHRTTPPKPKNPEVGFAWLLSVAPWAMRAIGPAVQAARVGIGRFGPALAANLGTAVGWVGGKIGPVLSAVKNSPAFAKAAQVASKALSAAGVLLGLQGAAKLVMPSTAAAVETTATAAVQAARRGGGRVARRAAAAAESAAQAVTEAPKAVSTAVKWGAAAALAAIILPRIF